MAITPPPMKKAPARAPTPQENEKNAPVPFPVDLLTKLDGMTKADLIALLRRVGAATLGVALSEPAELAEAMKLKLALAGLAEAEISKALPAMREWFDRELGKPAQKVDMTQTVTVFDLVIGMDRRERARLSAVNAPIVIDHDQPATGTGPLLSDNRATSEGWGGVGGPPIGEAGGSS